MRESMRRAGVWGLAALVLLLIGAVAATGGQPPLNAARAAPVTSMQDPPAYPLAGCLDILSNDDLSPEQQDAERQRHLAICEAVIASIPDLGQSGFTPEDFVLCASQAAGKRADGPGPALRAAIKQCTDSATSEAAEACQASIARFSSSVDAASMCKFIYQGTPLGIGSGDMVSCVLAKFILGGGTGDDIFGLLTECYQALDNDAAAERAILEASPGDIITLSGAEECLKLIGRGAADTDTAEARCAFILQAQPAGVDLNALARCIGSAADFTEAYRRCVEMLVMPTPTPQACPSPSGTSFKLAQPGCPTPTATATRASGPTTGGPCGQFSIAGEWQTTQGNGYSPSFRFTQSGTTITGVATLPSSEQGRAGFRSPTGQVAGTLMGSMLDFTVTWQGANGPVSGRYTATVVPGAGAGTGSLVNGSAGGQTWTGSGSLTCADGGTTSGGGGGASCNLTGSWQTQGHPDMVLMQSGSQVTGTFGFWGRVAGTLSGDTFTGTATDSAGKVVSFEFRMNTTVNSSGVPRPAASTNCQVFSGLFGGSLPLNFAKR
jgi:hypothetical protein